MQILCAAPLEYHPVLTARETFRTPRRIKACLRAVFCIPSAIRPLLVVAASRYYRQEILQLLNSPESLGIIDELRDIHVGDIAIRSVCHGRGRRIHNHHTASYASTFCNALLLFHRERRHYQAVLSSETPCWRRREWRNRS